MAGLVGIEPTTIAQQAIACTRPAKDPLSIPDVIATFRFSSRRKLISGGLDPVAGSSSTFRRLLSHRRGGHIQSPSLLGATSAQSTLPCGPSIVFCPLGGCQHRTLSTLVERRFALDGEHHQMSKVGRQQRSIVQVSPILFPSRATDSDQAARAISYCASLAAVMVLRGLRPSPFALSTSDLGACRTLSGPSEVLCRPLRYAGEGQTSKSTSGGPGEN